eukprot:CAMPEP_0119367032 /NCGR_PEP_ID=MMETSP1334-20130426/13849_1 /TAXON_ID=127549 /ORGANISM="Calcidiscus leptoporus, Strain RCC1130" /LENGTH=42 /DNA_ID= /DNA_START= /DNA_END= /DNA_ORIENTATION=
MKAANDDIRRHATHAQARVAPCKSDPQAVRACTGAIRIMRMR